MLISVTCDKVSRRADCCEGVKCEKRGLFVMFAEKEVTASERACLREEGDLDGEANMESMDVMVCSE